MIPIALAIEIARYGLERVPLGPLRRAEPLRTFTPLLVKRLHVPDAYYYLVDWQSSQGVEAVVAVDAMLCESVATVAFPQPLPCIGITAEQARSAVLEYTNKPAKVPELIWFHCHESESLFQPFYRVRTVDETVFVRLDGRIFTELIPIVQAAESVWGDRF